MVAVVLVAATLADELADASTGDDAASRLVTGRGVSAEAVCACGDRALVEAAGASAVAESVVAGAL
jgi:acyl-CoA reductase-like NAD-dependent aldehyde dehydrogenase